MIAADIDKKKAIINLIMEYGEIDLDHVLKRASAGGLDLNTLRLYWQEMLQAVQTIHEAGIVHGESVVSDVFVA